MAAAATVGSAWDDLVRGDVAACLAHLHRLPPLAELPDPDARVVDDICALLPQRLAAACGLGAESHCLSLLARLCADGSLNGNAGRVLAVATMTGVGAPIGAAELPEDLLGMARGYAHASGNPDNDLVFADTFGAEALGICTTALAPVPLPDLPGSLVTGLLASGLRRLSSATPPPTLDGYPKADPRAVVHLIYQVLTVVHDVAEIDREPSRVVETLTNMVALARYAAEHGLHEEAWLVFARTVGLADRQRADSPFRPHDYCVEALDALAHCDHAAVAGLHDLVSVSAYPYQDPAVVALSARCWATVRTACSGLGAQIPAPSRWRAANRALSALTDLPLHAVLDPARTSDPSAWQRAFLPLFCAHPFDWREPVPAADTETVAVKAVATDSAGGRSAWVISSGDLLDVVLFADDLHTALWRQPTSSGIWTTDADGIPDQVIFDLAQTDAAGFFPVVRLLNTATREASGRLTEVATVPDLVRIASTKLDRVYDTVRGTGPNHLTAGAGELVCAVGAVAQVPWERGADTAHVCLHPKSTGLSSVRVPTIRVSSHSPIAFVGDRDSLRLAHRERDLITTRFAQVEIVEDTSLESFHAAARRSRIVHVATHGVQFWQDPRNNTLRFAGGELTARDLARLDLTGVELVVLNACDAAAPGPWSLAGEGSVAGALLAAGARGVIGALWSVEESCAAHFACTLYEGLLLGAPLTAAFHRAHDELRRFSTSVAGRDNSFLADPYRLLLRGEGTWDVTGTGPAGGSSPSR